ncbi:S-adenosyl-L-methionine-dependent methyltransferase [Piptocephalis cylindrospora]|uniref:S-adenosyl-L-methionine-dependent methyltransferase n=1 Tax=Piptocephalis cylindrospora TaxID=1907219 RepID=A0A4P9Y5Z2_9FUNG|nr:S-adenosyl-L-methionine-dependent methyltransferase [Piptocephalis cylindrospora]|eukprot:RKP14476.1 S-adenosyl-L-methionine-dependent methyltransferase [Piptocephalis cylindrospora]
MASSYHPTPLHPPPRLAVDVGCGTGIWTMEMAAEIPSCHWYGIDMCDVQPPTYIAPNATFELQDFRQGLGYQDETIDYVHQQGLTLSLPVKDWIQLLHEYRRILRKGGWVEIVETDWRLLRTGPYGDRINEWVRAAARYRHIDVRRCRAIPEMLDDLGFTDSQRTTISLPMGTWGQRIGEMAMDNLIETLEALQPWILAAGCCNESSWNEVLDGWKDECSSHQTFLNAKVYWAKKGRSKSEGSKSGGSKSSGSKSGSSISSPTSSADLSV